ncbi:MAG: ribosomal-processing cysteine protease Prp [Acholeplasma sp.]|jgi:uncharacterized protein YsxB (DUF464 family)|nr:MAG: ribosomal-processing cysteine protease Prp [Acholeplasma sp.]
MITAKYQIKDGLIQKITVSGHAHYKKAGQDIVCAAVSAATLVTANAIEHLGLNQFVDLAVDDGYFKIELKEENQTIQALFENLKYTLTDFEKQYPKYMKNQKEG